MLLNILKSTRPYQWIKNLMVFLPLLFSTNEAWLIDDFPTILSPLFRSGVIFLVFVLASSAVYLCNDVLDKKEDIYHMEKKKRPIAAGMISTKVALTRSFFLAAMSLVICYFTVSDTVWYLLIYFFLMFMYSFFFRSFIVLDVLAISSGFVLRVLSGAVAIDVPVSVWLYVCMALGAMFIALSKRYAELLKEEDRPSVTRGSLSKYRTAFLKPTMYLFLIGTAMAYSVYAVSAENLPSNNSMVFTIPLVLFGMIRYQFLVNSRGLGEKPEEIISRDFFLVGCVVTWLSLVTVVLVLFR